MSKRPITTLFMLESLDGKISSGNTDELDADKELNWILICCHTPKSISKNIL